MRDTLKNDSLGAIALQVLSELKETGDPFVASLAEILLSAGIGKSMPDEGPEIKAIAERISALTERCLDREKNAASVVAALVEIDKVVGKTGQVSLPWAARLSPLAAFRMLHAALLKNRQSTEDALAAQSPIFWHDNRTLCAVPVGIETSEGMSLFIERVLCEAHRQKPKRVLLIRSGLPDKGVNHPLLKILAEDFAAQKISLAYL